MEFRLVYEGLLKASANNQRRVKDKHAIRKVFHRQLAALWETHSDLRHRRDYVHVEDSYSAERREYDPSFFVEPNTSEAETLTRRFTRYGFRFLPLVNSTYKLVCGLNILFLQRESPGDAVFRSGDLDNRIKTLLDALRVPSDPNEIKDTPEKDEDPFYCLLEDDKLINEFSVTTDRLLKPLPNDQKDYVVLIIHVKVKATDMTFWNMDFSL
jgi:hypothetical protein